MAGRSALGHQARQHIQNIVAREMAVDLDRQAIPRNLSIRKSSVGSKASSAQSDSDGPLPIISISLTAALGDKQVEGSNLALCAETLVGAYRSLRSRRWCELRNYRQNQCRNRSPSTLILTRDNPFLAVRTPRWALFRLQEFKIAVDHLAHQLGERRLVPPS